MCKFKKVLQGKELYLDIPHQLISEDIRTLLELEVEEFSTVFGCEVYFQKPPAYAPRWIFRPRHQGMDAAELEWSPGTKALISYADNEDEALQTFSLLHTLARTDKNSVEYSPPCTTQEAAYLIRDEVLNTFPSFELRKINPVQWAKQFDEPAPKDWNEFKYWAQKLIAQLQDAHTSIIENRFSGFVPPYRGRLYETGIILDRVPFNSDADQAGVAPGWMVRVEDSLRWLTTTGATPQQYRQIAARKALTVNHDYQRFTAFNPNGSQQISWEENPQQLILRDIVDVNQMDDCITYIGLRSFSPVPGLLSLFKDVCASSSEYSHMLLDLRGNVGGSIVLARELQPLFLREKRRLVQPHSLTDADISDQYSLGTLVLLQTRDGSEHSRF